MTTIDAEVVLKECKQLRRDGKSLDAIALLTTAIQQHPLATLFYERAINHDLLDRPQEALCDLDAALSSDPKNTKYILQRAYLFALALNRPHDAIHVFNALFELVDSDAEAHRQCCLCQLLTNDINNAVVHAKRALKLNPENGLSHFCLGQCFMSRRHFDRAKKCFVKAVDLDPSASYNWSALGRANESIGGNNKLKQAELCYTKVIELDPDDAVAHYARGKVRRRMDSLQLAAQDLLRALSLRPKDTTKQFIYIELLRMGICPSDTE